MVYAFSLYNAKDKNFFFKMQYIVTLFSNIAQNMNDATD